MTADPLTTIELLAKLGIKVFEVAQGMRINSRQRQELQDTYLKTIQAHEQIRSFLDAYRRAWERALCTNQTDGLYSLCTHQGYAQQLELIQLYRAEQIVQSFVELAELLDIRLITETRRQTSARGVDTATFKSAEAYIFSVQTLQYRHRTDIRVSSLQVCALLTMERTWKLDSIRSMCAERQERT